MKEGKKQERLMGEVDGTRESFEDAVHTTSRSGFRLPEPEREREQEDGRGAGITGMCRRRGVQCFTVTGQHLRSFI